MIFALLVFLAAFGIEGIGSYVSVLGLSALFAANPIIIVLAVTLDFAKVITVSFLYKFWTKINRLMKIYMTVASVVLITITSAGAFGFLSGEFQKSIADTGTQSIKITSLEEEKTRLQKRKEEIDAQIAKVPDKNVRGRTQLIKQFGPEVERVNDRLAAIDKELPALKIQNVDKEVHVGPIIYVAKAFNMTPEEAVKWVILTIIFVFDPLAVALLIAGNFLIDLRRKEKEAKMMEPQPIKIEEVILPEPEPQPEEEPKEVPVEEPEPEPAPVEEPVELELELELEPIPAEPTPAEPTPAMKELMALPDLPRAEEVVVEEEEEEEEEEENPKDETPIPVFKRHIKVEQRDGRDVIALETDTPRSSLENVNVKIADVTPVDSSHSTQTMKLYDHYSDDVPPEPVTVGGLQ